jgi:hypothetical protein
MTAARRGTVAAAVLVVGLVALLLTPGTSRADSSPGASTSSAPQAPEASAPVTTSTTTATSSVPSVTDCRAAGFLVTSCTTTSSSGLATESGGTTMTASTFSYAVLPGDASIPPTATPRPPPTPTPAPLSVTDTLTDLQALGSQSTGSAQATTVRSPEPGGDSSSVLPLTVLALLVVVGGGAVFLMTRLR